ncbi:MAG: 1-acyl-sn-glycerol-3-phosphate acyltransferase [Tannerella sp.]|jgi:1-acyl-sn-glycerol-3-phosphate acyltransferase|nr:1-acyl-sn-glycerol-3-phosphate acyltransferase [Tannerella sp.]
MNKETHAYDFDDIRPLNDEEVSIAIEELVASGDFRKAVNYLLPNLDWEAFSQQMRLCKTKEQFKSTFSYDAVITVAKQSAFSLTISGRSRLPKEHVACTFISNHRDIVLDAAFLNVLLYDVGHGLTQVAIGDNLLIYSWIRTFVRLNNCFIVKRDVSVRQMLETSRKLSAYIHHTIHETKESVWIAQREGRAKDSNDFTQNGVLKMLNMGGGEEDILSNLMSLNIVPIAISYEFDPCDYLKAQEFQLKRDNPLFVKSKRDDLLNMEVGILQNKGRVHFTIASPVNPALTTLDPAMEKNKLISAIASVIDREIYAHYRFYPCNYAAYDMLYQTLRFRTNYDQRDKKLFEAYLQQQLDKIRIPDKDETFLRVKLLEMYSNPLKNHLENKPQQEKFDTNP